MVDFADARKDSFTSYYDYLEEQQWELQGDPKPSKNFHL